MTGEKEGRIIPKVPLKTSRNEFGEGRTLEAWPEYNYEFLFGPVSNGKECNNTNDALLYTTRLFLKVCCVCTYVVMVVVAGSSQK